MEIRMIKYFFLTSIILTVFLPASSHASVLIRPSNYTGVTIKSSDSSKTTKVNVSQNDRLSEGLVVNWSFNGPDLDWSTNTVYDRSGNGYNATLSSMSLPSNPRLGKVGQALYFGGDPSDDGVVGTDIEVLDGETSISVFAWIKPEALGADDTIITKTSSASATGFTMRLDDDDPSALKAVINSGSNYATTSPILSVGTWTHVGFIYDGGAATKIRIYIDGEEAETGIVGAIPISITGNTLLLRAGHSAGTERRFNGIIDEVRIYNRVLSDSEISELYRISK